MKITKMGVRACDERGVDGCNCDGRSARENAIHCIKCAIDDLSTCPDDQICRDSIANLSVILIDLSPECDGGCNKADRHSEPQISELQ